MKRKKHIQYLVLTIHDRIDLLLHFVTLHIKKQTKDVKFEKKNGTII